MADVLSEMVFKLLSEWKVLNITAKITRRHCQKEPGFLAGVLSFYTLSLGMEPKHVKGM